MSKYRIIIIFGDGVGRYDNQNDKLLSFLSDYKAKDANDFRLEFQLSQRSFATEEEKRAFLQGVDTVNGNYNDLVIVTDGETIDKLLELFERKESDDVPSTPEQLKRLAKHIQDIIDSSWIPFASPNPSSTEKVIKSEILKTKAHLDFVIEITEKL